jgi:hypothetical protein
MTDREREVLTVASQALDDAADVLHGSRSGRRPTKLPEHDGTLHGILRAVQEMCDRLSQE